MSQESGSERARPDSEVKTPYRRFSAKEKLRILEEAEACTESGEIGALLRACSAPLCRVFPGGKLHHPAVYALLQEHLFPDEFTQAGPQALATTLTAHCETAFGFSEARLLVDLSRQSLVRPIGRHVIRNLVHAHTQDIITFQQRKAYYLKTG